MRLAAARATTFFAMHQTWASPRRRLSRAQSSLTASSVGMGKRRLEVRHQLGNPSRPSLRNAPCGSADIKPTGHGRLSDPCGARVGTLSFLAGPMVEIDLLPDLCPVWKMTDGGVEHGIRSGRRTTHSARLYRGYVRMFCSLDVVAQLAETTTSCVPREAREQCTPAPRVCFMLCDPEFG